MAASGHGGRRARPYPCGRAGNSWSGQSYRGTPGPDRKPRTTSCNEQRRSRCRFRWPRDAEPKHGAGDRASLQWCNTVGSTVRTNLQNIACVAAVRLYFLRQQNRKDEASERESHDGSSFSQVEIGVGGPFHTSNSIVTEIFFGAATGTGIADLRR
jgi:hypothetical protein